MRYSKNRLKEVLTYDDSRQHFQFVSIFIIMAFISAFMTVMNYFTGWRQALMYATLTFSLLNVLNAVLEYFGGCRQRTVARVLFGVEIVFLFTFFVINGQPKGFSCLWTALLPTCGLLIYKKNIGSLLALVQFAILIFLFYIPAGQQLLRYDYNDVFMMRFPVLYAAFFVVGLFFEFVRHYTQKELGKARDRYKHENFRILKVLADEYSVVVSVDVNSGAMEFHSGKEFVPPQVYQMRFYDAMPNFSKFIVSEEYQEQFVEFFSKENVQKNLGLDSSSILTFASSVKGPKRYYQARIVRIPEQSGEIKQFIAAFSDADAFVREQQQIQQELLTQRSRAVAASKAKSDFLFNMSHDIRTPMNAIIGFTDMAIKEAGSNDKVCKSLEKVRLSGSMLLSLINDILDMSRIESGEVTISVEPMDIETIFENTQSVMSDFAASKEIGLSFDVSSIRDRFVYADRSRVDRILVNLVSNAIKYSESNGFVQVHCEQIEDDAMPGYGTYRISVKDNGIGMSEEFQKRMFDQFSREENTTVRGIQGTGLGLPLVKKLSELMGGDITCESEQGVGSTFVITLPFKLRESNSSESLSEDIKIANKSNLSGKRVLLVEDNELNREIATYILEDEGLVVESAVDGRDAVREISQKGPDYYDIILMDIQMPFMNGYEAAKQIRAMYPDSGIPIIALSANAFEEDKQRSLASGMNAHISKPIDTSELLSTFSRFL